MRKLACQDSPSVTQQEERKNPEHFVEASVNHAAKFEFELLVAFMNVIRLCKALRFHKLVKPVASSLA